jgi:hypothetical protein
MSEIIFVFHLMSRFMTGEDADEVLPRELLGQPDYGLPQ